MLESSASIGMLAKECSDEFIKIIDKVILDINNIDSILNDKSGKILLDSINKEMIKSLNLENKELTDKLLKKLAEKNKVPSNITSLKNTYPIGKLSNKILKQK